jgi:hypothetical protein
VKKIPIVLVTGIEEEVHIDKILPVEDGNNAASEKPILI